MTSAHKTDLALVIESKKCWHTRFSWLESGTGTIREVDVVFATQAKWADSELRQSRPWQERRLGPLVLAVHLS